MDRVSEDENKIVVKVADTHLLKTKFGYALILNANNVVFIKDWQVSQNYFGNEVLLTREYFIPKQWEILVTILVQKTPICLIGKIG